MVETASVPNYPKAVPDSELVEILSATKGNKIPVSYRLTPEAIRIVKQAADLFAVDKTKGLEIALRMFREDHLKKPKR